MHRRTKRAAVAFAALLLPLIAAACNGSSSSQAQGKSPQHRNTQVGVVTLKSQPVPYTTTLPGRVVAYRTDEIRPQVDGLVRKRVFTEGHEVKAGDILYQLDATKFEAARAAAEAAVQKAQAGVTNAQGKYDRAKKLGNTNAVSAQDVENAHAALLQAQADLASARADLQTAQISLDHATIKAPISGRIGKSTVSDGALVTANQTTALATIRQLDPIYVDMVDSAANLLRFRAMVKAGNLGHHHRKGPPTVTLRLDDGSKYGETGKMDLAEVTVSQSTGTFSLRAVFPNPHRILLPGMFVRATVDLGNTPDAYLVPEQAVSHDSAGDATVFVVGSDSRIATRKLTTDRIYDNNWVVTAGLQKGDRIVVDGLQYISDGTKVSPVEVQIGKDGTVEDVSNAGAAANQPGMSASGEGKASVEKASQ